MLKSKKVISMFLAVVLVLSIGCIGVFAESDLKFKTKITEGVPANTPVNDSKVLVIEGEVGDIIKSDGIVYEIIGKNGVTKPTQDNNEPIIVPFSSKVAFNVALGGTTRRHSFTLSGNYKFWKVWVHNTQSSGSQTIITVEDSAGNQIGDTAYLPGGYTAQLYSDQDSPFPAGTYYVNFTSGNAVMSGTAACRLATTFAELDVQ